MCFPWAQTICWFSGKKKFVFAQTSCCVTLLDFYNNNYPYGTLPFHCYNNFEHQCSQVVYNSTTTHHKQSCT